MNIGIITNIRAPYRVLQVDEISKNSAYNLTIYYTDSTNIKGRNWDAKEVVNFREKVLKGKKFFSKYGYINLGLNAIISKNDILLIGGYSQPTYILLSILCRLKNKPYALLFDGISIGKDEEKNIIKNVLKKLVIKNASAYFANGKSGELFFNKLYNQPKEKIFNQFLTVDTKQIINLKKNSSTIRSELRRKYKILSSEKVLIYSGRVVKNKNLFRVIDALALLDEKVTFFVIGGGELENELKEYAKQKKVNVVITGFMSNQIEVFSHYFIGDCFILPSIVEPWGLVVNEAMAAGLNVIVSRIAGCSKDLVKNNGELIDPYNIESIKESIHNVLIQQKYNPKESEKLIEEWTFENSANSFAKMITSILS